MLYTSTVEPYTLGLLKRLMAEEELNNFNLVGGTALSLQIGHRKSIDLDFFTTEDFEAQEILSFLQSASYEVQVLVLKKQTLIVNIENIKVDFIRFRYPFAHKVNVVDGIRLAHVQDIACMKIDAIVGRGRKKDFYDLYFLLKQFTLLELMNCYSQMFQHSTLFHVYKSLIWFEDADLDGDINAMNKKETWEKAKKTILKAVKSLI